MTRTDPRLVPAYTVAEAARYLRIPAPTVRSWVWGRAYPKRSGQGRFHPIILPPADADHRLSFRNLIELASLCALRTEHGFKLSAVRAALRYAAEELGVVDLLASHVLHARPGFGSSGTTCTSRRTPLMKSGSVRSRDEVGLR